MSHGDYVKTLPQGFKKIASSKTCELASIANEDKRLYAVQFHPEVRHTMYGNQILHNFVFKICATVVFPTPIAPPIKYIFFMWLFSRLIIALTKV